MQFKENLVTMVIIAGFSILLFLFSYTFSENIQEISEKTSNEVQKTVNESATNVTVAVNQMVALQANLSSLLAEERETSKNNLELFLKVFANQSQSEVNATNSLEDKVVETLSISQNLTRESQVALQERNNLLKLQALQFGELIKGLGGNESVSEPAQFNLTLAPNATVSQQQQ